MKTFIALARVSSREQEREGFSLDVQEDALKAYVKRQGGAISKLFRIAETASKREERQTFKMLLAYAREHAGELEGILFYKVDRAARNLFDYVELERLELDYGLRVVYVAQPTENSPAGRMQRRILANMASFYTEQQSLDVKEGLTRRVQSGLFVGHAPYGYKNVRVDGRGLIEVDSERGPKVKRLFELYAYHNLTIDALIDKLAEEGIVYLASVPRFSRSSLHRMLRDRAYIGDVQHRGQWFPGKHPPLIDHATWERVQVLLGDKIYRSHELTYGGEIIRCAHCNHPITGELKIKKTSAGEKEYIYYRCARYNTPGHPRVRIAEADLDAQMLALFDKLRIPDDNIRTWFARALQAQTRDTQKLAQARFEDIKKQLTTIKQQKDRLLNLRLVDEIDAGTFSTKQTELRDRESKLELQLHAHGRSQAEHADLAVKVFELSQSLREKWLKADCAAKRQLFEILCLNCTLENTTLVPVLHKPFDVLANMAVSKNGRKRPRNSRPTSGVTVTASLATQAASGEVVGHRSDWRAEC